MSSSTAYVPYTQVGHPSLHSINVHWEPMQLALSTDGWTQSMPLWLSTVFPLVLNEICLLTDLTNRGFKSIRWFFLLSQNGPSTNSLAWWMEAWAAMWRWPWSGCWLTTSTKCSSCRQVHVEPSVTELSQPISLWNRRLVQWILNTNPNVVLLSTCD